MLCYAVPAMLYCTVSSLANEQVIILCLPVSNHVCLTVCVGFTNRHAAHIDFHVSLRRIIRYPLPASASPPLQVGAEVTRISYPFGSVWKQLPSHTRSHDSFEHAPSVSPLEYCSRGVSTCKCINDSPRSVLFCHLLFKCMTKKHSPVTQVGNHM